MPKNEPLTLHALIAKIKKPKLKIEEIVPGLFAGSSFNNLGDRKINELPYVYPEEHPTAKQYKKSFFHASMGETPQAVAHRAMAYGIAMAGRRHVPYSLEKIKELDDPWIERVRCATGVSLLSDVGVEEIDERDFHMLWPDDNVFHATTNAMHAMGTPQEDDVLKETKEYLNRRGYKKQAGLLKSMLYGTIEAAKTKTDLVAHLLALQEMFGTSTQPDPGGPNGPGQEDTDNYELAELSEQTSYDPYAFGGHIDATDNGRQPKWGTMEHVDLPLVNRMVQSGKKSKVWKRAAVGAFRFPWRALKTSDLQCFAVKRKVYGGTLLFDISGSMRITAGQIKTILEHSPEATMAAYGGHGSTFGKLVLMAKDGMAADPEVVRATVGSGNIVDGPALEWLCQQPEPRIWISDGQATGINDECDISHAEFVQRIAKANRIIQIGSAQELVDLLQAKSS